MVEPVSKVSNVKNAASADPESIPPEECSQISELNGTSMSELAYADLLKQHPAWEKFLTRSADGTLTADESILDWTKKHANRTNQPEEDPNLAIA